MDSSSNDKEKLAEIRRKAKQERIQRRQEEYHQKHAPEPAAIAQQNRTTPKKWVIVPALLVALAMWYAFSLTAAVIAFFVAWVVTLAYLQSAEQQQPQDFDEPEQAEEPQEVVLRFETSVESKVHEIDEPDETYGGKDNFEQFDYYRSVQLPGTGNYKINYKDQRGLSTERDIRIKRVHKDGDLFAVDAHCYLRNAHRSFIDDRIEYAINIDTGEEVDGVARDAIKQYEESDEGRVVAALDKEWIGVSILVFVCRADGQMRKPERAIVAEYVKKRCSDTGGFQGSCRLKVKITPPCLS